MAPAVILQNCNANFDRVMSLVEIKTFTKGGARTEILPRPTKSPGMFENVDVQNERWPLCGLLQLGESHRTGVATSDMGRWTILLVGVHPNSTDDGIFELRI